MSKTTKFRGSITLSDGMRYEEITTNTVDTINELYELVDKNIECGLLLDWDIKVKDTRLARKMYPDHVIRKGWLYAKE